MNTEDVTAPQLTETDESPDPKAIQPLEERRRRYRASLRESQKDKDVRLIDFLLALRKEIRQSDHDTRMKRIQDIDLMCRYLNGDQWGDYVNGQYTDLSREGDFAYSIPVIEGHFEQAAMMMLKTRIEYEFSAKNRNNPSHVQLAAMCETLAVEEKDRLMTEDAWMDEVHNALVAGESHRCLVWGIPEHARTVKRVDYKSEEIEIPGRRMCRACNASVPEGSDECSCGATFIKEIPPAKAIRNSQKGLKDVPLPENILRIPHPMAVKYDYGAQKFTESSYVLESDYLSKREAEWLYQTIISSEEGLTDDVKTRQELERATTQTDAFIGSANPHGYDAASRQAKGGDVQRDRLYVDPSRYGHFICSVEETLPDGTKLPAGTILGDKYPDGLRIEYIGDQINKFKPLNYRRMWSVVLYKKQAGSGRGKGMQSLITLQDIVNDTFNLDYGIAMASGRPLLVVNGRYVDEPPEAGFFLKTNKTGLDDVRKAVAMFPGQSVNGIVPMTGERIEAAMQFIEGTYSLQGAVGAPDQRGMSTATGIAALTENSSGRFLGPIKQRVFADKELMFQILENIRDYSVPEQKKELAKRFGPDVAQAFFGANFRQTINIGVAQNTDMPRSLALNQANMFALAQAAQGLAQVPGGMEMLTLMADNLGVPLNVGQGRSDRREAEYRLNKLAAIEERIQSRKPELLLSAQAAAGQMFTLLEEICGVALMLPPESDDPGVREARAAFIYMQEHDSFKDTYKDALMSEEARASWSQPRKLVVIQLWMEHFKAQLAGKVEGQKLIQEMQPDNEPDPEAAAEAQAAQDKRALAEAALTRQMDEEAKDADLERRHEEEDAKLERDLERREHDAAMNVLESQTARSQAGAAQ